MNVLVGAKVSITSRKAQTTRHRITGIQTIENTQYVYVDTPGFQTRHSNALNKTLNRTVTNTLTASDVILFVIEAGTFGPADKQVLDLLPSNVPCILVLNKADRNKDKTTLMPFAAKWPRIMTSPPWCRSRPSSASSSIACRKKCASCCRRIRRCSTKTTSPTAARNSWPPKSCVKRCSALSAKNCPTPARC
jgi:small GTP-binding protein